MTENDETEDFLGNAPMPSDRCIFAFALTIVAVIAAVLYVIGRGVAALIGGV